MRNGKMYCIFDFLSYITLAIYLVLQKMCTSGRGLLVMVNWCYSYFEGTNTWLLSLATSGIPNVLVFNTASYLSQ